MDSASSSESSFQTSASFVSEGEEASVLILRLRPRAFHLPRLVRLLRRVTPFRAEVLLDRPLPLFVLFFGSDSVGGRLLLLTEVSVWRLLSLCCRETRVCIAHFTRLAA